MGFFSKIVRESNSLCAILFFSTVCLLLSRVNHRYQILIIELKLSLKIALRQNLRVTSRAGMTHSVRVYILLHTPSAPPMLASVCASEWIQKDSAAMLAIKRSTGVTPEVTLRK